MWLDGVYTSPTTRQDSPFPGVHPSILWSFISRKTNQFDWCRKWVQVSAMHCIVMIPGKSRVGWDDTMVEIILYPSSIVVTHWHHHPYCVSTAHFSLHNKHNKYTRCTNPTMICVYRSHTAHLPAGSPPHPPAGSWTPPPPRSGPSLGWGGPPAVQRTWYRRDHSPGTRWTHIGLCTFTFYVYITDRAAALPSSGDFAYYNNDAWGLPVRASVPSHDTNLQ